MAKRGRPSDYTEKKGQEICALIAEGLSLRQIASREGMPDKVTILRWLVRHEEFRPHYAHAREMQAEHFADEILEIADDGTNDWMRREREDGSTEEALNHEHITRSRLRVDARKWLMAKMAPKKYGDKQEIEHKGSLTLENLVSSSMPKPHDGG